MGIHKTSELGEIGSWRGWWWGPDRPGQCSAIPSDRGPCGGAHRALGRVSEPMSSGQGRD